jgi:hypothetical protein
LTPFSCSKSSTSCPFMLPEKKKKHTNQQHKTPKQKCVLVRLFSWMRERVARCLRSSRVSS